MQRIIEFFKNILASDPYMPHGHCILWEIDTLALHVLSDLCIAIAYFSIPVSILYFLKKRSAISHKALLFMIAAFILLCGITHINSIITFWYPFYKFEGVVKFLTASISILTAVVIYTKLPIFLRNYDSIVIKNKDLNESNTILENFANSVAHDLKAPMLSILKLSEWIEEDLQDNINEDSRVNLKLLKNRATRLEKYLDDMLEYSKIGKRAIQEELVSLDVLIQEVTDYLMPPKNCNIVAVDSKEKNILLPRVPLNMIFINLISNAIKHNEGIDLQISISYEFIDNKNIFCVADNGKGINPINFDKIFELFTKLEARDQVEGSGMGLASVKKAIITLGGEVWVESKLGKGASFFFNVPLKLVKN